MKCPYCESEDISMWTNLNGESLCDCKKCKKSFSYNWVNKNMTDC